MQILLDLDIVFLLYFSVVSLFHTAAKHEENVEVADKFYVVFEVYCGNVDIGILQLSGDVGNVQRSQRLVVGRFWELRKFAVNR
jgi:hypothetical protein